MYGNSNIIDIYIIYIYKKIRLGDKLHKKILLIINKMIVIIILGTVIMTTVIYILYKCKKREDIVLNFFGNKKRKGDISYNILTHR